MLPGLKAGFALDARLEADSEPADVARPLRIARDERPALALADPGAAAARHRGNPRSDAARPGDADLRDQHGGAGAEAARPAAPRSTAARSATSCGSCTSMSSRATRAIPAGPDRSGAMACASPMRAAKSAGLPKRSRRRYKRRVPISPPESSMSFRLFDAPPARAQPVRRLCRQHHRPAVREAQPTIRPKRRSPTLPRA